MNTYVYVLVYIVAIVLFPCLSKEAAYPRQTRKSYLMMIILFALLRTENVFRVSNVFRFFVNRVASKFHDMIHFTMQIIIKILCC